MGDENNQENLDDQGYQRVQVSPGAGDRRNWQRNLLLRPGQLVEPVAQPDHNQPQPHRRGMPYGVPTAGVSPLANEYPEHLPSRGPGGGLVEPQATDTEEQREEGAAGSSAGGNEFFGAEENLIPRGLLQEGPAGDAGDQEAAGDNRQESAGDAD